MASSRTSGIPSLSLASTKASAHSYQAASAAPRRGPTTRTLVRRRSATVRSSSGRSSPSPTIASTTGSVTRLKASIRRGMFFCEAILPT